MGRGRILDNAISRRQFLAGAGVTLGAAALTLANTQCDSALIRRVAQSKTATPPRHSAWVWQFSVDGSAATIAAKLAQSNMSVLVKTHDGIDWMSKYDHAPGAITGPAQVANVASIFERTGVPFHAWSVIKGIDPVREAQMAADVLAAGARSLVLDLEGYAGFWVGSTAAAQKFGEELRRRVPTDRVDISIDARPWRLADVPIPEFVEFTDGIWPQLYWESFDTIDNVNGFRLMGYPPGPDGITPRFLVDAAQRVLTGYDRWIVPIGQGASSDQYAWPLFAHRAWELGMPAVSAWRFGVTPTATLGYLASNPPGEEPFVPPAAMQSPTPTGTPAPGSPTPTPIVPTNTPRPTRTPSPTGTASATPGV